MHKKLLLDEHCRFFNFGTYKSTKQTKLGADEWGKYLSELVCRVLRLKKETKKMIEEKDKPLNLGLFKRKESEIDNLGFRIRLIKRRINNLKKNEQARV